jgi:hypothetical protein
MAATVTPGYTFATTEQVTNTKLATLVSGATITNIDQTNVASGYGLLIKSSTEPADQDVIWIDTSATNTPKYYNGSAWTTMIGSYTPTAANALAGSVVQVVNYQTGAYATGSTAIPLDDTIPQITEGTEVMTLAITPTSATNKLKITVCVSAGSASGGSVTTALFMAVSGQDAIADALAATRGQQAVENLKLQNTTFIHYMTAGTTSAITFRVRCGTNATAAFYFNGETNARLFGGVCASSITIEEIKV